MEKTQISEKNANVKNSKADLHRLYTFSHNLTASMHCTHARKHRAKKKAVFLPSGQGRRSLQASCLEKPLEACDQRDLIHIH